MLPLTVTLRSQACFFFFLVDYETLRKPLSIQTDVGEKTCRGFKGGT